MATAITTKHNFTLSSSQVFEAEAHYRNVPALLKSENTPVAYIETLSPETPNVKGAELYHAWKLVNGDTLSAWYIPESEIELVSPIA